MLFCWSLAWRVTHPPCLPLLSFLKSLYPPILAPITVGVPSHLHESDKMIVVVRSSDKIIALVDMPLTLVYSPCWVHSCRSCPGWSQLTVCLNYFVLYSWWPVTLLQALGFCCWSWYRNRKWQEWNGLRVSFPCSYNLKPSSSVYQACDWRCFSPSRIDVPPPALEQKWWASYLKVIHANMHSLNR